MNINEQKIDFSSFGDAIFQLEKSIGFATSEAGKMAQLDLNSHDLNVVCEILKTYASDYAVWAFGSRVKGNAKKYSDLDLAIMTQQPLSFSKMAILKEAFDESDLPIRVDIVDWAETSETFQKIIEQDKVVIQESCKGNGQN